MTALLGLWLSLCVLAWLLLVLGVGRWGRGHTLAPVGRAVATVRVCVPARDEAGRIGPCVARLLSSDGLDRMEVVVVDDGSTDGTADEARSAGGADPRLRVLAGVERPEGWSGKAWAVHQAAEGATAEWLLFLDADVRVDGRAVASAVARAEVDRADLLSLFGTWALHSFWERVAIPAVGWAIRGAVDLDAVNAGGEAAPAFANGQFILVRRDAYLAWGGHAAVRAEVLDDVRLAEVARRGGARLRLLWAPWAFQVRLYTGLSDLVAGYRKNLYEGLGRRPVVGLAAALVVLGTSVLPVLALPLLAVWAPPWLADLAAASVALEVLFRLRVEWRDGRSGWIAPLHPLGAAVLAWVLASSTLARRVRWKGRSFTCGQADP